MEKYIVFRIKGSYNAENKRAVKKQFTDYLETHKIISSTGVGTKSPSESYVEYVLERK